MLKIVDVLLYDCLVKGGIIMTLGEKIKELRKDFNITQEEFAFQIGVSRQSCITIGIA